MAKTKMDKGCRMCIATVTECESCKKKSHYKEAEKPKCLSCRWCNVKAFRSGKWYCGSPKVSVFNQTIDVDKCFEYLAR